MSPALRIARHEWKLVLREPRFLLPFLVTPLILIGFQAFAVYLRPPGADWETLHLARILLLMLAVVAPSLSVPLSADSFAGERERNTLEILLCLPVSPGSLFWGKVLGILPFPLLIGWTGQAFMAAILGAKGIWAPGFGADLARAMAMTPCLSLFLCALTTWLSLISESVRGAAQLSSLVMVGVLFAVMLLGNGLFVSGALFSGFAAALLVGAWTCLRLARRRFQRLA